MRIGLPREIKPDEYRVGLTPAVVAALVARGHAVAVETGAGRGAGLGDDAYAAAGATIAPDAATVFAAAELIVKVKEPLAVERRLLRRGQVLFTYLHLAADPAQARDLLASGATAIAYETVTDAAGGRPLLAPMSRIAGRMAAQVAAHLLERPSGGRGILFGGVPGVPPANIVVLGGGTVGTSAAEVALAMGAAVTVVDRASEHSRLDALFGNRASIALSDPATIAALSAEADAVIGAAALGGAAAPKLLTRAMVAAMKERAVIVDVAIDQGGAVETSHPTTHSAPTFVVDGVLHYCVANMPGAVPRSATFALAEATRPFVLALADKGLSAALANDPHLRAGLNIHDGRLTCRPVADALGLPYTPFSAAGG
ncbi:MAG TPA: alanine dehydrogenase [Nitrobacter sp.]|nr:alanine dehydrogenase [Nitrobacter sp.]